jgi:hypothetical protein
MAKEICSSNPFIAIPSALIGMFLAVVILFLIFARSSLALLIPLLWGFVTLGIFAEFFALLAVRKK